MNLFLSKYTYNIDKKYRLSIPSSYREVLAKEEFKGFIAYPSFRNKCIEICTGTRFEQINKIIQTLDPYSEERDAFETIMMGEAIQLTADNEGRVVLPKYLMEHAEIDIERDAKAQFIGKGVVFEIWNQANFEQHLTAAKEIAKSKRLTLKNI
jgi:MraZ protein